jgi:hypothetical protein
VVDAAAALVALVDDCAADLRLRSGEPPPQPDESDEVAVSYSTSYYGVGPERIVAYARHAEDGGFETL